MTSALRLAFRSVHFIKSVLNFNGKQTAVIFRSHLPVIQACCYSNKNIEESLRRLKEGTHDTIKESHFRIRHPKDPEKRETELPTKSEYEAYTLPHPIWSKDDLENVVITHTPPKGFVEHWAYFAVKSLRFCFDIISGYKFGKLTEKKWLNRVIYLETIAGVPGMVAAMVRHLNSLRRMKRDHGWIHTLLEEAENERMHLMVALQIKKPSVFFRATVIAGQVAFVGLFSVSYFFSPRFCHRMVGYLEEEAVVTYSKLLGDLDAGRLPNWTNMSCPEVAIQYWKLPKDAKMRDMFLAIRADEDHHRVVNHTLSNMHLDEKNPFKPGE